MEVGLANTDRRLFVPFFHGFVGVFFAPHVGQQRVRHLVRQQSRRRRRRRRPCVELVGRTTACAALTPRQSDCRSSIFRRRLPADGKRRGQTLSVRRRTAPTVTQSASVMIGAAAAAAAAAEAQAGRSIAPHRVRSHRRRPLTSRRPGLRVAYIVQGERGKHVSIWMRA